MALRGNYATPGAFPCASSASLLHGLLGVWQVCHSPLGPTAKELG